MVHALPAPMTTRSKFSFAILFLIQVNRSLCSKKLTSETHMVESTIHGGIIHRVDRWCTYLRFWVRKKCVGWTLEADPICFTEGWCTEWSANVQYWWSPWVSYRMCRMDTRGKSFRRFITPTALHSFVSDDSYDSVLRSPTYLPWYTQRFDKTKRR